MSEKAFLWETEALRSLDHSSPESPTRKWLTLREANAETGISITTLRRWARKERIPSYLEPTKSGSIRMVDLEAVRRKAAGDLRSQDHDPARQSIEESPRPDPAPTPIRDEEPPRSKPENSDEPPTGTMLVPIDAWDKLLMQLGNLHQAGQELAEARERAAKAETEVRFLKERLAERRETEVSAPTRPVVSDPPPKLDILTEEKAKTPGLTRLMWRVWRTRPKG